MATIPKYSGYKNPFTSTTGKPYASTTTEARGDKEAAYLDPATPQSQYQTLYNTYGKNFGWMPIEERNSLYSTPAATTPAAAPTATPTTIPVAQTPAAVTPANSSQLFPYTSLGKMPVKTQVTIPKFNYDPSNIQASVDRNMKIGSVDSYVTPIENSPTFKYAQEEGQRALDAKMSASGLTGSGAEVEANRRMIADLVSRETERATENARANQQAQLQASGMKLDAIGQRYGQDVTRYGNDINAANLNQKQVVDNWQMAQIEADRLAGMQKDESQRLTAEGNENWNRFTDLMTYLQNANTMGYASDANNQLAALYQQMGPEMINYLMAMK